MDLPGKEKYNIFYRCTAKGVEYNRKDQMGKGRGALEGGNEGQYNKNCRTFEGWYGNSAAEISYNI